MRGPRPVSARAGGRGQAIALRPQSAHPQIPVPKPPAAPDADGVLSGPGRSLDYSPEAKYVVKDPLRDGEEIREAGRAFYAFPSPPPGSHETRDGPLRTLNISKFNEGRHNWQRIDTFNTPWGKGQSESPSPSVSRSETVVAPAGANFAAVAAAAAEASRPVAPTPAMVVEGLGQLREDLMQAVTCIISELRSDIKAEASTQRQTSSKLLEEIRTVRSELPANMGPPPKPDLTPVLTAVRETSREQAEAAIRSASASAAAAVRAEFGKYSPGVGEELAPLLRGKKSEPGCLGAREEIGCLSLQGSIGEKIEELSKALQEVQEAATKMDLTPLLQAIESSKVEVATACRAEPYYSQILRELKLLRTAADPAPVLEAVRAGSRDCEAGSTRLMASVRELQTELAGLELQRLVANQRAAAGREAEMAALMGGVREDLSRREADRTAVLQAIRERDSSLDFSEVLREVQRLRASVDLRPLLQAIEEMRVDVDLSSVVREIREKRFDVDFSPVFREIREQRPDLDLSPVLRELRDLRKTVDTPSVLREIREVKLGLDFSPVLAAVQEARTEVHRVKSEVDFTSLFVELNRKDEAIETRIVHALAEAATPPDLSPILRAVRETAAGAVAAQERRADADVQRLMKEVQRIREVDPAPVIAAMKAARAEADSALIAAVRASIPKLDTSEILQEIRQVKADLDFSLGAAASSAREAELRLDAAGRKLEANVARQQESRIGAGRDSRAEPGSPAARQPLRESRLEPSPVATRQQALQGTSRAEARQEQPQRAAEPLGDFTRQSSPGRQQDLATVLRAVKDVKERDVAVDHSPVLQEIRRLRAELDPAATLRSMREGPLEQVLLEVRRSSQEMLVALKAVRPESGLAAVLDAVRQTTTRADFALGMEELRGHFSTALQAISQLDTGVRPQIESLVVEAVSQAETRRAAASPLRGRPCAACGASACGADMREVVSKLWDIQQLMAKMGSCNHDLTCELERLSHAAQPPAPERPPMRGLANSGSLALRLPDGAGRLPQQ